MQRLTSEQMRRLDARLEFLLTPEQKTALLAHGGKIGLTRLSAIAERVWSIVERYEEERRPVNVPAALMPIVEMVRGVVDSTDGEWA